MKSLKIVLKTSPIAVNALPGRAANHLITGISTLVTNHSLILMKSLNTVPMMSPMAVNALPGRLVKKAITGRMPFCHTHTPAVLSAPNTVPTMSPKVETIWPGSRVKNPTTASTASVKIFFTSSNTLPKNLTMVPQCLISSMTPSTMRAMTPMMIIMGTTMGDSAPSTMNSETAHTVNAVASTPPMTMARAMATSLCFSSQVTAF